MEKIIFLIVLFVLFHLLNEILIQKKFLLNYNGSQHQKFSGFTKVPLSGGILIFISIIYLYYHQFENLIFLILLLFILGLATDLKLIISPKIRFLFQAMILFFIVYISDLRILSTRIYFIDVFISNNLINYCFSTFCLLILINGSNFIDGLNGLLLGYFLMISFILFKINLARYLDVDNYNLLFFSMVLSILILFNFYKKCFMGDTGAYILGFFFGYLLIWTYSDNQKLSPFFVILLLWYPCFENLFSILRKFKLKKSPMKPDDNHLHQLLFFYLKKKHNLKDLSANNFGSLIILLFNLIVFILAIQNVSNTKYQIILIIFNIVFYCLIYSKLFLYKHKLKY